jgi:hypothetical protein
VVIAMAKLSSRGRNKLSKRSFAIPGKRKYPIHDRKHAANALSRVSQHGSASQKKMVRAKVCARYPSLPSCK